MDYWGYGSPEDKWGGGNMSFRTGALNIRAPLAFMC